MRLIDLFEGQQISVAAADVAAIQITGLTSDSRRVRPGFLFAALPGSHADGRDFIADAVGRGAAIVLVPPGTDQPGSAVDSSCQVVPVLTDDNPRRRLALLAARFFGRQPPTVAAVTGTNGKTSVVWFLRQIWTKLGRKAASLGTLGIVAPDFEMRGSLTTPDPVALHEALAKLATSGIECLAIEASSHGLNQYRLDGVRIVAGAFTNVSRDHLDYHGSMEAYLSAKTRLFSELVAEGGAAVINADAVHADTVRVASEARGLRVLTFGKTGRDIRLERIEPTPEGQRLAINVLGARATVTLSLPGDFQASNALCALGLALACGANAASAVATLETLKPVPGRLEPVAHLEHGATIYVDYAHTPDALSVVLSALRPATRGRLIVVFGCGGDRDAGKRPEMGRIAAELAGQIIITDDNPRNEDPVVIRRQILASCPDAVEIGDRREAIAAAISELDAGDVLLIAGKGHETGQIVGDRVLPFDDAEVARTIVREADG